MLHVSTGGGYTYPCPGDPGATCGPAITPDGDFTALSFAPGWIKVPLGTMYNPLFFIGPRTRSMATSRCRGTRPRTDASGSGWTQRPGSTRTCTSVAATPPTFTSAAGRPTTFSRPPAPCPSLAIDLARGGQIWSARTYKLPRSMAISTRTEWAMIRRVCPGRGDSRRCRWPGSVRQRSTKRERRQHGQHR